jgi:hypothetical protein
MSLQNSPRKININLTIETTPRIFIREPKPGDLLKENLDRRGVLTWEGTSQPIERDLSTKGNLRITLGRFKRNFRGRFKAARLRWCVVGVH